MSLWAYIAVGGGLVGGALLFRKLKEQAPATPSAPRNPCDLLPAGQARDTCNTLRAGLGVVGAVTDAIADATQSRESKNVEKNGPIVESIEPAVWTRVGIQVGASGDGQGGARMLYPLHSRGVRHQNGCVPIPGHPDWAKCEPGTAHIIANGNHDDPTHFTRDCWWTVGGDNSRLNQGYRPSGLLSGGRPKDVFTFKWTGAAPAGAPPGAGELWAVRGKLIRCPLGQTVNVNERDHRTDAVAPICAPPPRVTPPPPVTPTTSPTTSSTQNASGGYTADRRDPNR